MSEKPLSRKQLAEFLPSHELVKKFEKLFEQVYDLYPDDIDDINTMLEDISIDASSNNANIALNILSTMQEDISINHQDEIEDEPAQISRVKYLEQLCDIDLTGITNGDLMQWSNGQLIAVSGATGTFTTADSKTVTVTNGIITNIV